MAIETIITQDMIERWTSKGYWGRETLADLLDKTVARCPEKVALVHEGRRLTYGELGRMVDRTALSLAELGLKREDFVIVELPNCFEFAYIQYALAKIGAIAVPVVHTYRQAEMDYTVGMCRAAAVFIPGDFGGFDYPQMMQQILPQHSYLRHVIVVGGPVPQGMLPFGKLVEEGVESRYPAGHLESLKPSGADLLRLQLSAGTTGASKGILHTHNDCLCSLKWDAIRHEWGEVLLLYFPLGHATGFWASLDVQVMTGRTVVLYDKRFDPEDMFRVVEKERVTGIYIPVPHLFNLAKALEANPSLPDKYDWSSLQGITFGGSPAHREIVESLRARLKRPILQVFGMAEGIVTSPSLGDPPEVQSYSVGRGGCPDAEVKVFDENNRELPLGEVGELVYRGPFVFAGYYQNPQLNREVIDEQGYVHSGDLVKLDEQGNIWIVGRKKDIIRRGAEPISPAEIEGLLLGHPSVADVAVVAMPDMRLVEKVCAYVVLRPGAQLTFEEMAAFLRGKKLATFKLPERLEIAESLPRGQPKGNILKRVLQEDITRKLTAEGLWRGS